MRRILLVLLFAAGCARDPSPGPAAPPPPDPPAPVPTPEAPALTSDEIRGEKLLWYSVQPGEMKKPDHSLVVFAGRPGEFASRIEAESRGRPEAPEFQSGDDICLYLSWGRRGGIATFEARFDRDARRIVTKTTWSGYPRMKDSKESEYTAAAVMLGKLEPGEYDVRVLEVTAVAPEKANETRRAKVTVRPRAK